MLLIKNGLIHDLVNKEPYLGEVLCDGTKIKYTTAKWLTPSKNCIDSIGLEPDYKIDIEYIYENDKIVDYKDTQLNKAIELLK